MSNLFNQICINEEMQAIYIYIQCITKVSTLLTFLQILKYIFSSDNTKKWHFDPMKSSLCAAYITELIYFTLKITQNITIKS